MNVGDSIGRLRKSGTADDYRWELEEIKIRRISKDKKGIYRVFAGNHTPIRLGYIKSNTVIAEIWIKNNEPYVLTDEWVLITPMIRAGFEEWVKWANIHKDEVDLPQTS
jgi:hypothetical protein